MPNRMELTPTVLGRVLKIVKDHDAAPARIKTAFMAVTGRELRGAGWPMQEFRDALGVYQDGMDDMLGTREDILVDAGDTEEPESPPTSPADAPVVPVAKKTAPTSLMPVIDPEELLVHYQRNGDERWEKVRSITQISPHGKPLRVTIQCKDPDTGEYIDATRNIKTQDLWQTHYTPKGAQRIRNIQRTARKKAAREAAS